MKAVSSWAREMSQSSTSSLTGGASDSSLASKASLASSASNSSETSKASKPSETSKTSNTSETSKTRYPTFARSYRAFSRPSNSVMPILRKQVNWETLYFYQKCVVLYRMTYVFCQRFLPKYGDRTVDQMVQAARSGKQNIVEGFADGVTSTEMELKLLNVARASIKELKEDYVDYLRLRSLSLWTVGHPRYDGLLKFCRAHNQLGDYESFLTKWTDEELANCANTLCHMVDRMMDRFIASEAKDFTENGGIKERMTAARLGRRQTQNEQIAALQREISVLKSRVNQSFGGGTE